MSYDVFAAFYDRLMSDCDYSARADYLLGLFCEYDKKPEILLDVCCGTGSLSLELAKGGCDVIAVDASEDMLNIASNKAKELGVNLLCLCQSAQELDLYGTVQGAVCTLDSINHIIDEDELQEAFNKVSLFLEKDCLFIFDVNTEYKHKFVLADNNFVIDDDEVYCVWQNSFDEPYTDISLDFFYKEGDRYIRSGEEFSERFYTDEELINFGKKAGLKTEAVFADLSREKPADDCERKIFVMRKM